MAPTDSLWPSRAAVDGRGLTSGTFYGRFHRYLKKAGLPTAGLHILRHTAAKLRRDAGESVEEVSRFLDHSSLAVTTTYLRRLEGQEDLSWRRVADAIGVVYHQGQHAETPACTEPLRHAWPLPAHPGAYSCEAGGAR